MEDFSEMLRNITEYDNVTVLYETADRNHKILIVRECARRLNEFLNSHKEVDTIANIRAYLQQMPLWDARRVEIDRLATELKN